VSQAIRLLRKHGRTAPAADWLEQHPWIVRAAVASFVLVTECGGGVLLAHAIAVASLLGPFDTRL
jgi:hypothetical protein